MVCLPVPAQVFAKQGPVRTIALVHHPHVVSVAECVEEKVKEGREREEHATKYIVFVFFAPMGCHHRAFVVIACSHVRCGSSDKPAASLAVLWPTIWSLVVLDPQHQTQRKERCDGMNRHR